MILANFFDHFYLSADFGKHRFYECEHYEDVNFPLNEL